MMWYTSEALVDTKGAHRMTNRKVRLTNHRELIHDDGIRIRMPGRVLEEVDRHRSAGLMPETRSEYIRRAVAMRIEAERAAVR